MTTTEKSTWKRQLQAELARTNGPKLCLSKGGHSTFEEGTCAMELVDYMARARRGAVSLDQRPTDAPDCVSPTIRRLVIAWNDSLPNDAARLRLIGPLLPLMLDTRGTHKQEKKRLWLVMGWLFKELAPSLLELCELKEPAAKLRKMGVTQVEEAVAASSILSSALADAGALARARALYAGALADADALADACALALADADALAGALGDTLGDTRALALAADALADALAEGVGVGFADARKGEDLGRTKLVRAMCAIGRGQPETST
jgi:hypothetical protein